MYHTITISKCALMRNSLIWLWLSNAVVYELYMTYPRLEFICCPNGCIEEICRLQFASTRIQYTIRALNVSRIGHQIWPKLSIIMILRRMFDILRAVVDILPTWIYERGLGTLPGYNTHSLHDTIALSYHDGQEVWFDKVCLCLCVWLLRLVIWYETPKCNNLRWVYDKCACAVVWCE